MNFYVYNYYPQNLSLRNVIVLIRDNWDDWFRFETKFNLLYISDLGKYESLGNIKIGQKGMADGQRSPQIPDTFTQLPVDCFSLGQSDYYYDALNQRGDDFRIEILSALRDIAYDNSLYAKVRKLDVTRISLMRDVSDFMIQRQFSRIAKGSARLTKYKIEYTYPQNGEEDPTTLVFSVTPESNPPTNIQVIIGRNNVGKTYLIKNIIKSIYFPDEREKYGRLRSSNDNTGRLVSSRTQAFANILCVSFSPFDNYDEILKLTEKRTATPFRYIGLTSDDLYGTLKRNFVSSLEKCMSSDRKVQLLSNALITLETDPVFERSNIKELLPSDDANNNKKTIEETKKHAETLFSKLSSGHQVIVLTLVQLIEKITERTLVILDEPENHLHPPLLSAFVRALSELLIDRNGVALIATHSPVILQEVPKSCVWKINRIGREVTADRLEIESFGATIGALTREVFGLEVRQSGFHKMIIDELRKRKSYNDIISDFNNELGDEARALLQTLVSLNSEEQ